VGEVAATPDSIVAECTRRGLTIGTGESLTAGLVAATLAQVPGCSAVLRGGIVAYHPDVKASMLCVPPAALSDGVVSERVAVAMAVGAAQAVGADIGIGTTGVAGPDALEGEPVGSVWVAVVTPDGVLSRHLSLAGDRDGIRCQTVVACWELLAEVLGR
jgi:nicotinamide-nucleotide amidase